MPLKTWDIKADYDNAYDYHDRASCFSESEKRASKFVELLNLRTNQKILILGCGFGWTVEALNNLGYTNIVGVDTSPYILDTLASDTTKEIYKGVSSILADEGTFKPQVVITEHLIESYTDSELTTLLAKYASVTVAHLIVAQVNDPTNTAGLNLKPLAEWKALFPSHTFIENGTWGIM